MLDSYTPMLEYNTVSGMVNRIFSEEKLKQRLEMTGILETESPVTAIIIRMKPSLLQLMDEKSGMLFKIHLMEMLKGICRDCCLVSEVKTGEIVAAVFAQEEEILQFCKEVEKGINTGYKGQATVGIGGIWEDACEFYKSYQEADRALKYAYFRNRQDVFCWSEYCLLEGKRGTLAEEVDESFNKELRAGNEEKVYGILEDVKAQITEVKWQYEYMNEWILGLVRIFARYCKDMHIQLEIQNLEDGLQRVENIEDFWNFFAQAIQEAFAKHKMNQDGRNTRLAEAVCEYVNLHLEEDISMAVLSERMGVSEGHLSRIFKKEKNMSILEYITGKRMEEAQKLLKETDLNVETIAKLCGYRTFHYFGKKFKECTGYTPTAYREAQK